MIETVLDENICRFKEFMETGGFVFPSATPLDWLASVGFFTAPASTKYHGAYEGGLFDHSLAVAKTLVELTNRLELKWERPSSPYIVGMFHDLCKADFYCHPKMGVYMNGEEVLDFSRWEHSDDCLLKGHGDKSVMLLSTSVSLTMEEVMCIRYHMGAFTDKSEWSDYTRAVKQYPNVLWTHTADMLASHVQGV